MDGRKKRGLKKPLSNNSQDKQIEMFVKEKGWYVPTIHEKYLKKYID